MKRTLVLAVVIATMGWLQPAAAQPEPAASIAGHASSTDRTPFPVLPEPESCVIPAGRLVPPGCWRVPGHSWPERGPYAAPRSCVLPVVYRGVPPVPCPRPRPGTEGKIVPLGR